MRTQLSADLTYAYALADEARLERGVPLHKSPNQTPSLVTTKSAKARNRIEADAFMRACGLVVAEMGVELGAIRTCSHSTEVGTAWRMRSHARQIRPSMRFRWLKHPNTTASGRTPSNARVGSPVPDWLIAAYWNLCPEMKYVGGMYSLRMSRRLDRT